MVLLVRVSSTNTCLDCIELRFFKCSLCSTLACRRFKCSVTLAWVSGLSCRFFKCSLCSGLAFLRFKSSQILLSEECLKPSNEPALFNKAAASQGFAEPPVLWLEKIYVVLLLRNLKLCNTPVFQMKSWNSHF